ncbi:MAG: tyrosine-type recombinase/integrase [Lachnospiraceae bacterium]|nr:tyrosine-type recombinase/integrase [Lachnospiraceae bacterium]
MPTLSYHEQKDIENIKHLRMLIKELPDFCTDFFRGIEPQTSTRTRIAYAYDLRIFFEFLRQANSAIANIPYRSLPLSLLEQLTVTDLEEYLEYLKCHPSLEGADVVNTERGIMRKVASLRSFYNYFYRNQRIEKNVAALLRMPKLHEKEIIRLEIDEIARLLDLVEEGDQLTEKQKIYHERTRVRDLAMLSLLLGTGIRVSECVGLNLADVDLDACGIRIFRKGGKEAVVYFSDEVCDTLKQYVVEREQMDAFPGHEEALFLSMQRKRINVRSVEKLVKKYSRLVTPLKKITPHKLRSTYGTNLYRETGDIYLVASVLGHNDVNTTKKHYAALEDERRRSARNKVRLREEP